MIFDGESEQLLRPRKPKTKNYNQKSLVGINNDVDGFGQVVITESNNGKVADILNIIDLQQTIIEKDFLINVTHPKEQKSLIELVERMKPEDNPIVRIFTLR